MKAVNAGTPEEGTSSHASRLPTATDFRQFLSAQSSGGYWNATAWNEAATTSDDTVPITPDGSAGVLSTRSFSGGQNIVPSSKTAPSEGGGPHRFNRSTTRPTLQKAEEEKTADAASCMPQANTDRRPLRWQQPGCPLPDVVSPDRAPAAVYRASPPATKRRAPNGHPAEGA